MRQDRLGGTAFLFCYDSRDLERSDDVTVHISVNFTISAHDRRLSSRFGVFRLRSHLRLVNQLYQSNDNSGRAAGSEIVGVLDVSCSYSGSYWRSVVFTDNDPLILSAYSKVSSPLGLGLPLTRYILRNTGLSVVALTSKTSNRVKDDILSTVDDGSQKSLDSRLRVVTGVDLLDEKSVANASMEAELGKDIRLLACFAGEVMPFTAFRLLVADIPLLGVRSYNQKNRLHKSTWPKHSTLFNSTHSVISCSTSTSYPTSLTPASSPNSRASGGRKEARIQREDCWAKTPRSVLA